ncbi:hypothetical protein Enr17x_37150 [Gimesia fumaroli]|uniref:Uncharacterized protein n=1 Tax=Gimesia fumaroli TaxID=2527976 RepID=A0A518IF19_9PLAN|nr:hypothetical protein Enr17x_37150 [Gimesia fumaroli]
MDISDFFEFLPRNRARAVCFYQTLSIDRIIQANSQGTQVSEFRVEFSHHVAMRHHCGKSLFQKTLDK